MSDSALSDIVSLEQRVRDRPDNPTSWKLLGIHHFSDRALEKAVREVLSTLEQED